MTAPFVGCACQMPNGSPDRTASSSAPPTSHSLGYDREETTLGMFLFLFVTDIGVSLTVDSRLFDSILDCGTWPRRLRKLARLRSTALSSGAIPAFATGVIDTLSRMRQLAAHLRQLPRLAQALASAHVDSRLSRL